MKTDVNIDKLIRTYTCVGLRRGGKTRPAVFVKLVTERDESGCTEIILTFAQFPVRVRATTKPYKRLS